MNGFISSLSSIEASASLISSPFFATTFVSLTAIFPF